MTLRDWRIITQFWALPLASAAVMGLLIGRVVFAGTRRILDPNRPEPWWDD